MKSEEIENSESHVESNAGTSSTGESASVKGAAQEVTSDNSAELLSEVELVKKELADWKDKYTRLFAEFDNFRKRNAKERIELLQSAGSDVIKELLPILDDFDRAIKANENLEDIQVIKEGFGLIHHKLYKKLEAKGLVPIAAINQPFNTDFHEAITSIPVAEESQKGMVMDEVEKGYILNEKVIRFSKVVIGQ